MDRNERPGDERRAAFRHTHVDSELLASQSLIEHRLSGSPTFVAQFVAVQNRLLGIGQEEHVAYYRRNIPVNFGRHVAMRLVEDSLETGGLRRIQKAQPSPDRELLEHVKDDLAVHIADLRRGGMKHLVSVYDPRVEPQVDGHALVFEQVLFPFGSTLDWMRRDRHVEEVTRSLIEHQTLPLQRFTDPRTNDPAIATASLDNNLKNFIVAVDEGGEIKTLYCDFTPPRVIDPSTGRMKEYVDPQTQRRVKFDLESHEQSEAKRFLKDMQIANFVIRNVGYILDTRIDDGTSLAERQHSVETFLRTIHEHPEMRTLIQQHFGVGVTAYDLAELNLNELVQQRVDANVMGK